MKKKILSLIMVACMATASLVGCGKNKAEEHPEKLTFTYVTALLNIPSIVEREAGIFTDEFDDMGIKVEYAELTSGADQTQALASGDVQVLYAVGASSVILSAANGADIKVLNMYSRSPKAFCLYAKGDTISTAEDLRGKTVAGPAGTNLHELLVSYLATADMTIKDVNYVNMSIPEAKAALDGGSIDAALLAGATAYQAKDQGYHLIADGEGLIDALILVAVTNEFYEKYPEIIDALNDAQEEIGEFMREDEEEALAMTAKALDLNLDAVKEMYRYYDFSTKVTSGDKSGFQRTADFMYENGMIEKKLNVDILF